jgi:hypothetical protein
MFSRRRCLRAASSASLGRTTRAFLLRTPLLTCWDHPIGYWDLFVRA